jgi:hypothetical protein
MPIAILRTGESRRYWTKVQWRNRRSRRKNENHPRRKKAESKYGDHFDQRT